MKFLIIILYEIEKVLNTETNKTLFIVVKIMFLKICVPW